MIPIYFEWSDPDHRIDNVRLKKCTHNKLNLLITHFDNRDDSKVNIIEYNLNERELTNNNGTSFFRFNLENNMYGLTSHGGEYNNGSIILYDEFNDTVNTVYEFDGNKGSVYPSGYSYLPYPITVKIDDKLYGTTQYGGTNQIGGTLYEFDITTNEMNFLLNFGFYSNPNYLISSGFK
jgi:uncharacterized repeat protein (TIGR03803 family)